MSKYEFNLKKLPSMQETWVQSLGWEDPLEKGMTTHSSNLAWRILWTEEFDRLQLMGLQRVGYNWVSTFSFSLSLAFNFNKIYVQTTYSKDKIMQIMISSFSNSNLCFMIWIYFLWYEHIYLWQCLLMAIPSEIDKLKVNNKWKCPFNIMTRWIHF